MPAKRGRDVDWVMIRYRDVLTIVALVVLIGGGLGGGYFYWRHSTNPQVKAERALTKAQHLIESLEGPDASEAVRQSLVQARATLEQARAEYTAQRYPKAFALANDLVNTLKDLQNTNPSSQRLAVLVSQEGTVEVKKANQHLFSSAKENALLEDGDIVKTSRSSYAKIKYPNGQYQTISPDSLVVIQALSVTAQGGSRVEVALKQGRVETVTSEAMTPADESVIKAGNTQIRPGGGARVGVSQTEGGETTTSVFTGSTQVESGGHTERVEAGATGVSVITAASGGFLGTTSLVAPPSVVSPRDQQVLRVDDPAHTPISFEWRAGGTPEVVFQLSAKPLFSSLLTTEQTLKGERITVDGLPAGSYYWRVRSTGAEDKTYWSPTNRFRIIQVFQRPRVQRDLRLEVEATPIGDGVILKGRTDPGVSVAINELEVPVSADGTFSKIELFGDKGSQPVQVRAFDEEGNEKIWRKVFQSAAY